MLVITDVVDELRSYKVPEECINRVMVRMLNAGAQSVYASLGEISGRPTISPEELSQLVAVLIAQREEPSDGAQNRRSA